jgi:phosphate:Na+ symporter
MKTFLFFLSHNIINVNKDTYFVIKDVIIIGNIILIIGGLSLFMFGLNFMRESLIKINNERLKKVIQKATGSKFKALVIGILTTSLIQSSSGVTAIVVALISSNLLTFSRGVMIMIGSNIGTTTTAFIFTLNIEEYSLIFVFIGSIF